MFKNGKTKQGRKRVKNFCKVLLRKENGMKNGMKDRMRNGDVGKKESFRKEF